MKIAIRADGGLQIGMGHIMRTLVLAKELVKNNDVFYVCKMDTDTICGDNFEVLSKSESCKYKKGIEKIVKEGFKVFLVRENSLLQDLKNIKADLLITDSYDVNEDYFHATKNMFAKTAYIDDMNLYNFDVDFLINQNAGAENFNYIANKDTKLMLGTKYTMMREEFRNISSKYIKLKVSDIMITVGGADPYNITKKLLHCIEELDYNFHVILGPSFNNTEDLRKFQSSKIKFYCNANMCEIMKNCDAAVSACGSTLYELAACGVPILGVIIADNQIKLSDELNDMGIIKNLGWYHKLEKKKFLNTLECLCSNYELRKEMSIRAFQLIDGKGAERIVHILTLGI